MSKSIAGFAICEDKNIEPHELANLFASVGWGDDADYQAGGVVRIHHMTLNNTLQPTASPPLRSGKAAAERGR